MIKMIYKGRSPAMRHVLRTFRVDLDWLFERVRVDPGIFMKYVNTKKQLADMLTKGSFTAAQWGELCSLFSLGPGKESLTGTSKGPEKAAASAATSVAPGWAPRSKESLRSNTKCALARQIFDDELEHKQRDNNFP